MQTNLILPDPTVAYSTKEFGPIVVALAFVIAIGGMTAAAIILCGWRGAKNVSVNVAQRSVVIACR